LQRPKSSVDETTHANRNSIEAAETGVERTLEDVLNADDSDTMLTVIHDEWQSNAGDENVKDWEQIALNTHKQLEHTRELLNECEASNVRLSEQSKLLKEEIRRLERNEQRKDHMANSEYLKNVILKVLPG
uniref:Rab_bind domain-containing protein n=1 Tax=Anisakis simplex TaxID=6269 RepID=A0A0M3KJV8_ANISI